MNWWVLPFLFDRLIDIWQWSQNVKNQGNGRKSSKVRKVFHSQKNLHLRKIFKSDGKSSKVSLKFSKIFKSDKMPSEKSSKVPTQSSKVSKNALTIFKSDRKSSIWRFLLFWQKYFDAHVIGTYNRVLHMFQDWVFLSNFPPADFWRFKLPWKCLFSDKSSKVSILTGEHTFKQTNSITNPSQIVLQFFKEQAEGVVSRNTHTQSPSTRASPSRSTN